ncbi:MAG: DnaD domain protein [Clostridia bacterium]|nr:DnaD domain protein [Clostridia bacterium]
MKFTFTSGNDTISLPKNALLNKLNTVSEAELKVLICASAISAEKECFDAEDIQKMSGLDLTQIIIALQFWRGSDVLSVAGQSTTTAVDLQTSEKKTTLQKNEMPNYSGEDVAKLFESNTEIKLLIDECQQIAGKMFNPYETNKIISLYDYIGLSSEYILLLYNYCKNKGKTVVHYVEKTALNLYDEGVDTAEKLQEYIKYKERTDSIKGKVQSIFGINFRSLTKKEGELIEKWSEVWGFGFDVIEYAYELTVNATNKSSLSYANKILENWRIQGITTLEGAKALDEEFKKSKQKAASPSQNSSFDDDEFFEAALKRSYENIGKKPD